MSIVFLPISVYWVFMENFAWMPCIAHVKKKKVLKLQVVFSVHVDSLILISSERWIVKDFMSLSRYEWSLTFSLYIIVPTLVILI